MTDGLSGIVYYLTWSPAPPKFPRHVSLHKSSTRVLASSYNSVIDRRGPETGNWRDGHTSRPRYTQYREHMHREISSKVRCQLEIEVDRYLVGCENSVRLNFLSKLPNIAMSVHRVYENIQPPPGFIEEHTAGGTGNEDPPIPGFAPAQVSESSQLFEQLESQFQSTDGFDFNTLGNAAGFEESSCTSGLSDGFDGTTASSNTSFDNASAKGQTFTGQRPLRLSEQFSQVPFDPNYYSYGPLGTGGYDYRP